jgi:hypothetical protein
MGIGDIVPEWQAMHTYNKYNRPNALALMQTEIKCPFLFKNKIENIIFISSEFGRPDCDG